MAVLTRLLLVLGGYVFGLFQTGYFYGKIIGRDLRKEGSGNTGATNALRVLGVKAGLIVFFFDALKAFIPCFIVGHVIPWDGTAVTPYTFLFYTAFGVTLGNDFPFYLKFKGGKGVAALSGIGLAFHPVLWLVLMSIFFIIAFATRYVSLASIISVTLFAVSTLVFGLFKFQPLQGSVEAIEVYVLAFLLAGLLIWRHKENILRLLSGTENRFGKKKT